MLASAVLPKHLKDVDRAKQKIDESGVRLSVLDQAPVAEGSSPADALDRSLDLARRAEALGFHRFWMSEHHAMDTLACSAPEIVLARIGAHTRSIRLGSGGIMLPHYAPLKVAEQFRTLHAMFPGRIDLGIGRAPGGGPVEALALRRERRTQPVDDFPDQLAELLGLLDGTMPENHPFRRLRVSPLMPGEPDVWLLGSSLWSARAAAEFGLPYAFAHFFSPLPTREAIESYRQAFVPGLHRARPEAMVAVGVICADTDAEAQHLFASVRLLQQRIRMGDRRPVAEPGEANAELQAMQRAGWLPAEEGEWPRYVVGTPEKVRGNLLAMAHSLALPEILVNTIVWDHAARLRSYELLASVFDLGRRSPVELAHAG